MKNLFFHFALFFALIQQFACGESQKFVSVPKDLNMETVPKDTIEVIAKDFEFIPDTIRVKEGTLVTLKLKSIEGTHGFELGAFGIDATLEENIEKIVDFYAAEKGIYGIRCSHFCGIGHLGMTGELIIE
jgi:cytochrome c oxidase subunit II